MAPSIASSGHAPTILTLKPLHTDPQPRQTQHYRLPRISQQTPPPRLTPHTPAFSQSVSAANTRNPRSIPNSSLAIVKPTVVNTHNTIRAPHAANGTKTSDALSHRPKSPPSTRTIRQPVTTVARIHTIAPFGATSIDSVLHAGSTQDANKTTVPDRIRPKAEAINTACPMIAIKLQDSSPPSSTSTTLYAHQEILTKSSTLLQNLLKTPPKPTEAPSISLQESDAKSLNIYLNYLYTSQIHAGHRKDEAPTKTSPEGYTGLSRLVKSYNLGFRLQDSHFRDAILDAIVTLVCIGKKQGKTMLGLIMQRVKHHYIQLPAGSKARRLFVHLFAHFGDWRLLEKSDAQDFLVEIREVIKRGKADDPTVAAGKCVFHEHDEGGRCYRDL